MLPSICMSMEERIFLYFRLLQWLKSMGIGLYNGWSSQSWVNMNARRTLCNLHGTVNFSESLSILTVISIPTADTSTCTIAHQAPWGENQRHMALSASTGPNEGRDPVAASRCNIWSVYDVAWWYVLRNSLMIQDNSDEVLLCHEPQ